MVGVRCHGGGLTCSDEQIVSFHQSAVGSTNFENLSEVVCQDVSNKKMGLAKVDFDETFATVLLHDILPTAAPEFKKQTEDGPSKSSCMKLFLVRNN